MEQLKNFIRSFQLDFKKAVAYFIYKVAPFILLIVGFYPGFWGVYMIFFGGGFELGRGPFDFVVFLELLVLGFALLFLTFVGLAMIYEWAKSEVKDN